MLGARVPMDALMSAVARSGSPAVMVWAHDRITGDYLDVHALRKMKSAPAVVLGGPGWPGTLPDGAVLTHDLTEAVTRLSNAARGLI